MRVAITQEMIKRGGHETINCPVTIGVLEACGHSVLSVETLDAIMIDGYVVETPNSVIDWVRRYDKDKAVGPFSFELNWEPNQEPRHDSDY